MPRLRKPHRRRAPPQKVFDMRDRYHLMPNGRTVAVAIEEPGGLFSSDSATLEPARRRDGTLADGAPEWVPPSRPTIIVVQSIHRDPLGQMWARDQIDRARYFAGRSYQELHALAEIGNVKAMDPAKPLIDGGVPSEVLTDRQHRAAKRILDLNAQLFTDHGHEGLWITKMVLIEKISVARAAGNKGQRRRAEVDFLRGLLRKCLTRLAIDLGYATGSIARESEPAKVF